MLHVIGSHYTYERMPVGTWLRDTFDLSRNPYDRVVHCLYGFLIFLPVRELLFRRARLGMAKELFIAFCIVSTGSMLYELVEWFVAVIVDPSAGPAFLAMNGTARRTWRLRQAARLSPRGLNGGSTIGIARGSRNAG